MTISKNISTGDQKITISFDTSIYSIKAIKRAIYDSGIGPSVNIRYISDGNIQVDFSFTQEKLNRSAKIIEKFKSMVFEHQIRLDVEDDYRIIRQIIVAQAFQPCDNIQEIIDAIVQ